MTQSSSWHEDVMQCVAKMRSNIFELADIYEYEEELAAKHPENAHIQAKIRQQLQVLRDEGYIEFLDKGQYKKLPHSRFDQRKATLYDLEMAVTRFCEERDWDQFHNPKDLAIGISTEANELLDIFRFKTPEQMTAMLADEGIREHISDELADVVFFLLRFARMNNFDLAKSLEQKLAKNDQKYPADRVRGNNLKYTEYE